MSVGLVTYGLKMMTMGNDAERAAEVGEYLSGNESFDDYCARSGTDPAEWRQVLETLTVADLRAAHLAVEEDSAA